MPNINLKLIIFVVISLSALLIGGSLLFGLLNKGTPPSQPQQPEQQIIKTPATPAAAVSSFSAVVKEISNEILTVETQAEKPQQLKILLDENVTYQAWVNTGNQETKAYGPPRSKSAADLKIGQRLDIRKTEFGSNKTTLYDITIYED